MKQPIPEKVQEQIPIPEAVQETLVQKEPAQGKKSSKVGKPVRKKGRAKKPKPVPAEPAFEGMPTVEPEVPVAPVLAFEDIPAVEEETPAEPQLAFEDIPAIEEMETVVKLAFEDTPAVEDDTPSVKLAFEDTPAVEDDESEDFRHRDIAGIPALRYQGRTFVGLRSVLQADGWKIRWRNHKLGVLCESPCGDILIVVPGRTFVEYGGKRLASQVPPRVARSGQVFLPLDLMQKIVDNRLTIVERNLSAGRITIRLADAPPVAKASRAAPLLPKNQVMVSLRQILEADGWTVEWKSMTQGAICTKGKDQRLVVIPNRTRIKWNDTVITSQPKVRMAGGKLFVPVSALEKIFAGRISLGNIGEQKAVIHLAQGN